MALPIKIFNKKILYQDPRTDGMRRYLTRIYAHHNWLLYAERGMLP